MSKIILNGIEYSNGITYQELQPVIYSTEEREIGVWTDGKPLYQKTVVLNNLSVTNNQWSKTNESATDIETIVDGFLIDNQSPSQTFQCDIGVDSGKVAVLTWFVGNSTRTMSYLTFRYTKTTDTAGSGSWTPSGVPSVHYSTNEQVIGTWIDGKPLYEKTISCGALPNNTTKNVAHSISDIEYAVIIQGSARNPNNGIQIPLPYVYGNTRCLQTYIDSTNIKLISTENMSAYTQSYVTLRYTKTTD